MELHFFVLLYLFYIKSEVQLECQHSNKIDRCAQIALVQAIMNNIFIMLDNEGQARRMGGAKCSGSIYGYPQTDSYNLGIMTN